MSDDPSLAAITLPDLGMSPSTLTISVWLVPLGAKLVQGDRVVEISTGDVVVDLPAPVPGVLVKKELLEDDAVQPGQILGWIQRDAHKTPE